MVLSWFIGKLISAPHRQLMQRERERDTNLLQFQVFDSLSCSVNIN